MSTYHGMDDCLVEQENAVCTYEEFGNRSKSRAELVKAKRSNQDGHGMLGLRGTLSRTSRFS